MTNFSRILNTLTGMHFEDRNQFINSLNRYSLLIIDDLGIERNSDFALEQVFNVIDSRYRSKKPLIITTNLTLSELNNAADIAHKRIYDRILERCIPVRINNRNIRQDKQHRFKDVLHSRLSASPQSYNTLDFPTENRVPRNHRFLWILPVQGERRSPWNPLTNRGCKCCPTLLDDRIKRYECSFFLKLTNKQNYNQYVFIASIISS